MCKYEWNALRFVCNDGGSTFGLKCVVTGDVLCVCDFLSGKMSVVTRFCEGM